VFHKVNLGRGQERKCKTTQQCTVHGEQVYRYIEQKCTVRNLI
jgi:hypothetical protein